MCKTKERQTTITDLYDRSAIQIFRDNGTSNMIAKEVTCTMITIDVTGRSPIYEQICHGICAEISRGVYQENDRIPAARALAKELGLNPNTVAKAYGILERDGIIYSVAGKGCFVAKHEGKADKRMTSDFEEKTRELLAAGIPADSLIDIVRKADIELKGGEPQ